jgi:hypothetical protein
MTKKIDTSDDVTVTTGSASVAVRPSTTTTSSVASPPDKTVDAPPADADHVALAIAEVQAEDGFRHLSAEHLEVAVVRKLLQWGYDLAKAEHAVRTRLY